MLKRFFIVVSAFWVFLVLFNGTTKVNGISDNDVWFAFALPAALIILYLSGRWIVFGGKG